MALISVKVVVRWQMSERWSCDGRYPKGVLAAHSDMEGLAVLGAVSAVRVGIGRGSNERKGKQ